MGLLKKRIRCWTSVAVMVAVPIAIVWISVHGADYLIQSASKVVEQEKAKKADHERQLQISPAFQWQCAEDARKQGNQK
jgi:hypothetical protein